MTKPTNQFLEELLASCYSENRIPCVDLLITKDKDEILVQKRANNRRLFPGWIEKPGGHAEEGESFEEIIKREIKEELDIDFVELINFVGTFDWESSGKPYRNFQFLGTAAGQPILTEPEKTTEFKWINLGNLDILLENREPDNDHYYRVVRKVLQML